MNYVRKLGFEESPDYDFLRDLFYKVLKNIGEQDDRVFDWCLLNGGKGWEYGSKSQQTAAALHAHQQREHRHREHARRSRPTDAASPQAANGQPIILAPAAAQVKERERARRNPQGSGAIVNLPAREVSMSVQPIAPASRHLRTDTNGVSGTVTPNGTATPANGGTHPYASASASPITPNGGGARVDMGGPFPRTTSNSPLPPIPGDGTGMAAQSGSNVALGGGGTGTERGTSPYVTNGGGSYNATLPPTMQRGLSMPKPGEMIYGGGGGVGLAGAGMDQRGMQQESMMGTKKRSGGFFDLLCCRG